MREPPLQSVSHHRKRSTQSDTALLPSDVYFQRTLSPSFSKACSRTGGKVPRLLPVLLSPSAYLLIFCFGCVTSSVKHLWVSRNIISIYIYNYISIMLDWCLLLLICNVLTFQRSHATIHKEQDMNRNLDKAIEVARSMKRTTDRIARSLSADQRSIQPEGGRKHHVLWNPENRSVYPLKTKSCSSDTCCLNRKDVIYCYIYVHICNDI